MASLDRLPIELLHHILGYLVGPFSGRMDSTGLDWSEQDSRSKIKREPTAHPLYQLAAVSRHLNATVEGFCKHLLLQYKIIGNFKIEDDAESLPAGKKPRSRARKPKLKKIHRRVWMMWSFRHCVFCGRKSERRAIFNNHIRCCAKCDRDCFPDKITMTAALKEFDLRHIHLFAHVNLNEGYWEYSKPAIRCASYDCQGVLTRLFFRSDVVALAREVHGDLDTHLKAKEERKRVLSERREQRLLEKGGQNSFATAGQAGGVN